jgi:hypothetical protein
VKLYAVKKSGVHYSSWSVGKHAILLIRLSRIASQVGMPYIRAKAQDYFEELGGGLNSDILDETLDARQIQALTDQVCTSFLSF